MTYRKYGYENWHEIKQAAREILEKEDHEECTDEEVRNLISNDEIFRILASTIEKLEQTKREKKEKESELQMMKSKQRTSNCCCGCCCK